MFFQLFLDIIMYSIYHDDIRFDDHRLLLVMSWIEMIRTGSFPLFVTVFALYFLSFGLFWEYSEIIKNEKKND